MRKTLNALWETKTKQKDEQTDEVETTEETDSQPNHNKLTTQWRGQIHATIQTGGHLFQLLSEIEQMVRDIRWIFQIRYIFQVVQRSHITIIVHRHQGDNTLHVFIAAGKAIQKI